MEGDDPGKGCVMEAELNEDFWMFGLDSTAGKGIFSPSLIPSDGPGLSSCLGLQQLFLLLENGAKIPRRSS